MQLDMSAPAILLWVEKDKTPSASDFVSPEAPVEDASIPHGTSSSPYWVLEDAVDHAIEVMRDHNKAPWIKTGDKILGPNEIQQAYSGLKALRMFNPDRSQK
ncbi:MAG: hypothetical protein FJX40_11295 [Alphaproteobacteria bacterium]|jgi:hypothetical protein|nr:hypothetical protein [Alphaproteobacteria bacterium]MBM3641189.1 hypothetical protein [Alphaproteobacteria bacterium]